MGGRGDATARENLPGPFSFCARDLRARGLAGGLGCRAQFARIDGGRDWLRESADATNDDESCPEHGDEKQGDRAEIEPGEAVALVDAEDWLELRLNVELLHGLGEGVIGFEIRARVGFSVEDEELIDAVARGLGGILAEGTGAAQYFFARDLEDAHSAYCVGAVGVDVVA